MKWSVPIGRVGGTEVRLHLTMLLLIPYAVWQFQPGSLTAALYSFGFIFALFASVLLHELGHALVARRYGIQVQRILLWPLGGFTSLSRQPDKPLPTLIIAAAGPAVNLFLAAILAPLAAGSLVLSRLAPLFLFNSPLRYIRSLPLVLLVLNLVLAVFNLIPIYPLDGGQMMHALLHQVIGRRRADLVSLVIGLPLAVIVLIYAIGQRDYFLLLVSVMLLLGVASLNRRFLRLFSVGYAYLFNRGAYYLLQGDFDPAIDRLNDAVRRHPLQANLYANRGLAYLNLQEYDLARADLDRALELDPHQVMAASFLGDLEYLDGRLDEALAFSERVVQMRPDWAGGYADRGLFYREKGDLELGLADLNRAVQLGEGYPKIYLLRAMVHYRLGDFELARADGDRALKLSPAEALVHPAIFLQSLRGYLDWALVYYGRAIEQLPGSPLPYQGRGDAYLLHQQFDQAIQDYTSAIRLVPYSAELYMRRGYAYRKRGRSETAAVDFQKAVDVSQRAHLCRQARAQLQEIRALL